MKPFYTYLVLIFSLTTHTAHADLASEITQAWKRGDLRKLGTLVHERTLNLQNNLRVKEASTFEPAPFQAKQDLKSWLQKGVKSGKPNLQTVILLLGAVTTDLYFHSPVNASTTDAKQKILPDLIGPYLAEKITKNKTSTTNAQ